MSEPKDSSPMSLAEVGDPWGHAQNDSLAFVDFMLFHQLNKGELKWNDPAIQPYAEAYAALLPTYFKKIHAWEDWDLGAWEDRRGEHASSLGTVVAALRERGEAAAGDAADLITSRSPISVSVALEALRRAATLDSLEDVLVQEYRTSCASLRSHDLVEGIRAQVIDKDRNPKWSPPSLAAVTRQDVEDYFAPADPDLTFEEDK